jgi:hypothetical protein
MATTAQLAANRKNALASTGPKTSLGKAKSARNALRFGIYSEMPAVPGLERAEEWDAFRAGIVANLVPLGTLEEALAERVAVCLWRLRRTVWFETAITAAGLELVEERFQPKEVEEKGARSLLVEGENLSPEEALAKAEKDVKDKKHTVEAWEGSLHLLERLPQMPDDTRVDADDAYGVLQDLVGELPGDDYFEVEDHDFLIGLGLPADECDGAYSWEGWTAGMVRKGLAQIANEFKRDPQKLLGKATESRRETQTEGRQAIQASQRKAKELRQIVCDRRDRMLRGSILPDTNALQKVARYEAHLSRQMTQALHELQRLQAARDGQPFPPPATVDVTLHGSEDGDEEP